jgi:hypothetical protein
MLKNDEFHTYAYLNSALEMDMHIIEQNRTVGTGITKVKK